MDKNKLLKELERKSDYSINFMEEIFADITKLNDYPTSTISNKLGEISIKIEHAREQGIYVDSLYKLLLEFRLLYFFNIIDKKIEDANIKGSALNTDLSLIEEEYNKLKQEESVDKDSIEKGITNLYNQVGKSKLLLKLKNYSESDGSSIYSLEEIQNEYLLLKDKGINLDDIEKILFEN